MSSPRVAALNVDAVAVSLLFSYLDDRHERRLGEALRRALPGVPVTLSSEVAREFREYPRTATTVINAALRPVIGGYMQRAAKAAAESGVAAPFLVMQSNGGSVPAPRAEESAHRLVLSGPAGGVAGLVATAARHGLEQRHQPGHGWHVDRRLPGARRAHAVHHHPGGA